MEPARLSTTEAHRSYRLKFILSYSSVCLIWGSTYLAVRFALETLPIFTMGGIRFIIAGAILFVWTRLSGAVLPNRQQFGSATVVGLLLIMGGNAGTMMAVKFVPTGVAALIATTLPMWTVLFDWLRPNGTRPRNGVIAGLLLGFAGIVLLMQPWNHAAQAADGRYNYVLGSLFCVFGTLTWASGSLYARHAPMPVHPLLSTAIQLIIGGLAMGTLGALQGEWSQIHLDAISMKSLLAFVYLIMFGSIVTFTAYGWLIRNVSPPMASSYTYVNPFVAVILGAAIGGEPLTSTVLLAGAIIIGAVLIIAKYRNASTVTIPATIATTASAVSIEVLAEEATEAV